MAGVGRGRVIGAIAALTRLAIAAGIGCVVFAGTVALILAEGASPAVSALATDLGMHGTIWAVVAFVVQQLLRMTGGRPAELATAASTSWHNQTLGPQPRPPRVLARQPQSPGWWTVLNVPPDAAPATFESAARGLLRQSHPDRWATADPVRRQEAEGRTRIILQALAEARATTAR